MEDQIEAFGVVWRKEEPSVFTEGCARYVTDREPLVRLPHKDVVNGVLISIFRPINVTNARPEEAEVGAVMNIHKLAS